MNLTLSVKQKLEKQVSKSKKNLEELGGLKAVQQKLEKLGGLKVVQQKLEKLGGLKVVKQKLEDK